jgi:hypothetical protein
MAPLGSIDFCKFSDSPTSKRFCPDSVSAELIFHGLPVSKLITVLFKVCTAGDSGCACEDNVCPAVEKIVGLLSVEALWALIFLLTLSLGLLSSACVYMLCCRPAPRQVRTKCKTNQTSNVVVSGIYAAIAGYFMAIVTVRQQLKAAGSDRAKCCCVHTDKKSILRVHLSADDPFHDHGRSSWCPGTH